MKKRADGLYQKKITVEGKPKIIYGKTQAEVTRKIMQFNNDNSDKTRMFLTVSEEWQDNHFKAIQYNTIQCYLPPLKQIKEHFGNIPIAVITPKQIQTFINKLASQGYAKQTVKVRLIILRQIFNYAILQGYIENDPSQSIQISKKLSTKKTQDVSDDVITAIHKSLDKPLGLLAYLLLYTGCRLSEALALQWEDIDFEANLININKIVEFKPNQPFIRENTKTEAGNRQIVLLNNLKEVLLNIDNKNGYIINIKDKPITKTQYRKNWAKLDLDITAHQLRHEYATILFNAGVDVKTAQVLLGHSSITVTMDIYTHLHNRQKQTAADRINEYIKKGSK